jgi:hypothetical protein
MGQGRGKGQGPRPALQGRAAPEGQALGEQIQIRLFNQKDYLAKYNWVVTWVYHSLSKMA